MRETFLNNFTDVLGPCGGFCLPKLDLLVSWLLLRGGSGVER